VTAAKGEGRAAAPARRRPAASKSPAAPERSGNGTTKAFEAPHRREQETFLTNLAGATLARSWRTASWLMGHLPAGPS